MIVVDEKKRAGGRGKRRRVEADPGWVYGRERL